MESSLVQALESGDIESFRNFLDSQSQATSGESETSQTPADGKDVFQLILEKATGNQELANTLQRQAPKLAVKNEDGISALDQLARTEGGRKLVREVLVRPLLASLDEEVVFQLAMEGWSDFSLPEDGEEVSEEINSLMAKVTDLRSKSDLLHEAIRDGRLEDVKSALEDGGGIAIQAAGNSGLPPLQLAVACRRVGIVQFLVNNYPQALAFRDNMGRTALHYAAWAQDGGSLYRLLKDAGADDKVTDKLGKTPSFYTDNPDSAESVNMGANLERLLKGQGQISSSSGSIPATEMQDKRQTSSVSRQSTVSGPAASCSAPPKPQTPPGPKVVKPVAMYVSPGGSNPGHKSPPPSFVQKDGAYVAQHLGNALTLALADIAEKRPWDPIEYLANWLYKYHDNEAYIQQQAEMLKNIREAEAKQNETEQLKFKRKQELLKLQEEQVRMLKEAEDEKKRQEMEELQRSHREAALAQKPQLPTVSEDQEAEAEMDEDNDPEVKDRDARGFTEMHKLASQQDIDVSSLIELGYSVADRDVQGRTVRDIAQEAGRNETVKAIDNYIKQLLADGSVDYLENLVLEGYDGIQNLADENIPEVTKTFLQNLDTLKEKMNQVQNLSDAGKEDEIKELLSTQPELMKTKDKIGRSLLHRAVLSGQTGVVDYLATSFPDMVNARDNMNRTPLHYTYDKSDELAALLVAKGAKPNAKDVYKQTPAYYRDNPNSLEKGNSPTVTFLETEKNADKTSTSSNEVNEVDKSAQGQVVDSKEVKEESQMATTMITRGQESGPGQQAAQ